MYNAPQLTLVQLAFKKYKEEQPIREAVASFQAKQMYERGAKYLAIYEKNRPFFKGNDKSIEEWGEGDKMALQIADLDYTLLRAEYNARRAKKAGLPVASGGRNSEIEELFGNHHSKLDPFDAPRVVKRGREDDVVDDHNCKHPRSAAINTSTVPPASSAEVEPQHLPDTIDTPVVPQATLTRRILSVC